MSEAIYIAGPECFYIDGNARLNAMRRIAEARGHSATLPNDTPLKLDNEDLRINADIIFENCAQSMNASTAIICDLEFYRGAEPDGGSIYEIGMAYARGIKCYAYTRDKRNMCWKYQGLRLLEGKPYDLKGRALPYTELPFSPNVIGSTKIVEGDFSSALTALENDAEEERKFSAHPGYKSWKPEFTKRPLSPRADQFSILPALSAMSPELRLSMPNSRHWQRARASLLSLPWTICPSISPVRMHTPPPTDSFW